MSEIDAAILAIAGSSWRKVAFVVGRTRERIGGEFAEREDAYQVVASRVQALVGEGRLVSQGDITKWRHSEVRLPRAAAPSGMIRLVLIVAAVFLSGCGFTGSIVKSVAFADHGGISPAEYDALVRDSIDTQLVRETKGEHPDAGVENWRHYWQWRYSLWRKYPDADKWIAYTRKRRQELGLRYI